MSAFRVGGLALTLVEDVIPTGSVVTLAKRIETGDRVDRDFIAPSPGWFVIHETLVKPIAYADPELMPLRGDAQPEQQKEMHDA
ncbi:hypothetical protein [Pseudomonas sp. PDM13]|uniref:hypothetical protein n=1 Tax=Pseudomonas sp. PDM13 TaxID=2769255 RepID=UPI0021E064A3|nr:hypothetical protein [Pseudomonas sp. PDM13]MCU9947551.1 hypothetical protein [Pseudomonas sp. PDM13]